MIFISDQDQDDDVCPSTSVAHCTGDSRQGSPEDGAMQGQYKGHLHAKGGSGTVFSRATYCVI